MPRCDLTPSYHYALANLAEIRKEQKNYAAAAELYRRRYASAPHPENLYDLGDALAKAGKRRESKEVFAKFEAAALAESARSWTTRIVNSRCTIWTTPKKPVRVFDRELEASRRRDVHTLEVYAKALRLNGKEKESQQALAEAGQRLNATLIAVRR